MLIKAAITFFVLAILAAVFGFTGLARDAAGLARIAFYAFLVIAVLSFVFGRSARA